MRKKPPGRLVACTLSGLRFILGQSPSSRIDLASGLDAGASPGYGVFNVSGSHPLTGYLTFNWALDNLFDNTWAPHVSRSNGDPFNPEAVRVNEPGRTVRAALTARW